jgi:formylglycine-generating enzyme required for sulfatase activity
MAAVSKRPTNGPETLPSSTTETPSLAPIAVDAGSSTDPTNTARTAENTSADAKHTAATTAVADMVRFEAASFQMGSSKPVTYEMNADETPVHTVRLRAFYLDRFEVTAGAYAACVNAGSCPPAGKCNYGKPELEAHPINCVNWYAAKEYCAWKGRRLPTEEEWEYAARGTARRLYPWGAARPARQICWRRQHVAGTCSVDSHPEDATPEGVVGLGGNVMEWVSDVYCSYDEKSSCTVARVIRGCNYVDVKPYLCRGARRSSLDPGDQLPTVGFRCAMDAATR